MIDLRSDTTSLPSPSMRAVMAAATVGDDYYRDDPSVTQLEQFCAQLFRKEAALFVTSGMLANQLAVRTQVTAGNEVVTEATYHMHLYESAQYAALAHVVLHPRYTADGILRAPDVERAIDSKPREPSYAQVQMVAVENTVAGRQGKVFPFEELTRLRALTQSRSIRLHLDGARIFNAHLASGIALTDYAAQADTMTVSFSKGPGAPFGAILLGPAEVIERARRMRLWYGSAFHQAGIAAAAAQFALTRQLDRLREDHRLAKILAHALREQGLPVDPDTVETNMVFVDAAGLGLDEVAIEHECRNRGVLVTVYPPHYVRLVVCRNVDEGGVRRASEAIVAVIGRLMQTTRHTAARYAATSVSQT